MTNLVKVKVLRTVLVAGDTIYGRKIIADTEDEVPAELFEGLRDAGYVKEPDAAGPVAPPTSEIAPVVAKEAPTAPRRGRPRKDA